MKINRPVTFALGILLSGFGIFLLIKGINLGGLVPTLIGGSLIYLGFSNSRIAVLVFGHTCIIIGAYLITWGIYLLPHIKPEFVNIFSYPLFWGLISLFGGICANYHGFCRCIKKNEPAK